MLSIIAIRWIRKLSTQMKYFLVIISPLWIPILVGIIAMSACIAGVLLGAWFVFNIIKEILK